MIACESVECVNDTQIRFLTLGLDVLLCSAREIISHLVIPDIGIVGEGGGQCQDGVMEHGRVVRQLWQGLGGGDAECPMHIAEEEFGDDPESPACEELEEKIEKPKKNMEDGFPEVFTRERRRRRERERKRNLSCSARERGTSLGR